METFIGIRLIIVALFVQLYLTAGDQHTAYSSRYKVLDSAYVVWQQANISCVSRRMRLAQFSEKRYLIGLAESGELNKTTSYWVGLTLVGNQFIWSDGSSPSRRLVKRLTGQNRDDLIGRGTYFCLTDKRLIFCDDCSESRPFICETKGTTTAPSASSASAATPTDITTPTSSKTVSSISTKATTPESTTAKNGKPEKPTKTTPTGGPNGSEQVKSYNKKIKLKDAMDPLSLNEVLNITSDLLGMMKLSGKANKGQGEHNIMGASQELEKFLLEYAKEQLKNGSVTKITKRSNGLSLTIEYVAADIKQDLEFPPKYYSKDSDDEEEQRSFISLPSGIFEKQGRFVVSAMIDDVGDMLPIEAQITDGEDELNTKLYSAVVSCTLDPEPAGALPENVTITLRHDKETSTKDRPSCVFWDINARTAFNGSWSRRGCSVVSSNANTTVCTCNHMTSFALLMQVDRSKSVSQKHKLALQVITFVGCALSLGGEVITVIAYVALMNVKAEQSQIRLNLVVSLAIAQVFFISGISATENKAVCIFVAVVIHYMYLVAFGWMMLEGVYLYLMVVKVFNTVVKMKLYYAFSWGFPLLVVLLSIVIASTLEGGISSYINNEFCWVSFSTGLVWTFVAPVLLISLVNLIVLVRVVRELMRLQSAKASDTSTAKQGAKACVVLFPLLGLTWVFGILAVTDAGLAFQYIFTILNSLQGFLIFVFHVLRSSEIRLAFQRKRRQWETTRGTDLTSTKSHADTFVSYSHNKPPLTDLDSTDSARRNRVAPSPQPVRADSARTCITPVENARDNWGSES